MAMTLRLPLDDAEALRRFADLTQRSMHEVVREVVRDYIDTHSHETWLNRVLDEELPAYASALERLGQ